VRFLRRNAKRDATDSTDSTDGAEQAPAEQDEDTRRAQHGGAITPGKGRPTPKRREAETRRRGPVAPPPRSQREALRRARGSKEERRTQRAERRERMLAGDDDRYLLPRDRGPVRAYVRDLVDSRRNLMGLFVPMALVVLLSVVVPNPAIQNYVSLATMAMLLMIVVEGVMLGRYVTRRVRHKFPKATDRGISLGWYTFTRATMLRRFRAPRPRVKYGQEPR
jgi:Protein of unknown function (DUF3043)